MNLFQAGDGDLFLISLKAGGTGLNLTAADYVIHMDPGGIRQLKIRPLIARIAWDKKTGYHLSFGSKGYYRR